MNCIEIVQVYSLKMVFNRHQLADAVPKITFSVSNIVGSVK